jgi:hypothetical protein
LTSEQLYLSKDLHKLHAMAVEPILASSLWTTEEHAEPPEPPAKRRRLASGCASIDASLDGGFDYGAITCISSEAESGAKELSYSLIATHLLLSKHSEATIVDTTNSFDVRRLHKRLVVGLHERQSDDDAKALAVQVLERVRIMKAFDFVGMTECVAEVGESLETRRSTVSGRDTGSEPAKNAPAPRGTVGDSEDEDEMLDDTEPTSPGKASPPKNKDDKEETPDNHLRHLLVIDNITSVASPIIKNSHVQGQALLATFMRSLAHLTQTHDVCTILHNATMTYPTKSSTEPTPSIFTSCTLRPALGKLFAYLLDTHLLLHRVPLTAADAKSVYAAHSAIPKSSQKLVSVLEVLQDKHSDRVGHWSAFRAEADGNLAAISA